MPKESRAKILADAFLGRRSQPEPEKPWYTPGQIAQTLCALPDEAFDGYVYAREPLEGRIDPPLRRQLAQKARESGRQAALALKQANPGKTVEQICQAMGLAVRRKKMPQDGGRVLYAQFVQPGDITLFTHCLDTAAQYAQQEGPLACLLPQRLEPVLLAHELYHAVEERDKTLFASAYRLRLWSVGPLHNDSPLVCLSEMAGMAFAKELAGLDFCPYALDALLLYGYDPAGACAVCDEIAPPQNET